jgi:hypothetical protein
MKKYVAICAALGALIAAPIGGAARPVGTLPPSWDDPLFIPAGFGCAFDVLALGRATAWGGEVDIELPDGRTMAIGNGLITLTNLDTGGTYVWHSDYRAIETFPDADTVVEASWGKFFVGPFLPGDQGPFGEVGEDGENGGLFGVVGTSSSTFDLNTEQVTSFSYQGRVIDICAALTG